MVGLSSNVSEIVCGRNAVMEALKSGRSLNKILVAKGERQGSIKEVLAVAKEHKIIIQEVEMKKLGTEGTAGFCGALGILTGNFIDGFTYCFGNCCCSSIILGTSS